MAASSRSVALVIVGIALIAVSLLADVIGVGSAPGIGWKQLVGAAVGIVLAVAGIAGLRPART